MKNNKIKLEDYCNNNNLKVHFITDDADEETSYNRIKITYKNSSNNIVLLMEDIVPNSNWEQLSENVLLELLKMENL